MCVCVYVCVCPIYLSCWQLGRHHSQSCLSGFLTGGNRIPDPRVQRSHHPAPSGIRHTLAHTRVETEPQKKRRSLLGRQAEGLSSKESHIKHSFVFCNQVFYIRLPNKSNKCSTRSDVSLCVVITRHGESKDNISRH